MSLKGVQHKDICFKCKIKFENNHKMFNVIYLNEEDDIQKFLILCENCFNETEKNNHTIYWQNIFKKPISKREFVNNLREYFFSSCAQNSIDERTKYIIAYILYQQHILKIKEETSEEIIFLDKGSTNTYIVRNLYGKISPKFVKNVIKEMWGTFSNKSMGN